MDTRYIVALEIASSKVKGLAASVGELGDINVIAVEEIRVNDSVRYGKIQNVQEVSVHVNDIIRKLENNPHIAPRKISTVFLSLGGRSMATTKAQSQFKFPNPVEITAETIKRLKNDASFGLVTDKINLEMLPYAFYVDNKEVKNVVGTVGSHIRAVFSALVMSPAIRQNFDLIKFEDRNLDLRFVIRPTAIADLVLSSSEKQRGCVLVDFGAETTTVAIYKDDVLQSIITLPIGSRNITRDLVNGLSMTEESAETSKIRSGSAIPTESALSSDIEINNYISARAGEIVANILHQIDAAGFKLQNLPAGIILTGGGSRLRNFDRLVETQSKLPVRIAAVDSSLQFKCGNIDRNANIDLLAIAKYATEKSDISCMTEIPEAEVRKNDPESFSTQQRPEQRPRRDVDDDSLLEDDEDDIPTTESQNVRISQKKKQKPSNPVLEEDLDDDNDIQETGSESMLKKIKDRLAKFWVDTNEIEDDDLDDPAN